MMDTIDVHSKKTSSAILSNTAERAGRYMEVMPEQLLNAPSPTWVTDSGISTSRRDLHPRNACAPIRSREPGRTNDGRAGQFQKAYEIKRESGWEVRNSGMRPLP
jgi:hypothetical protein